MIFKLIDLPYSPSALQPYISEETITYHYHRHHQTYVSNLNNLLPATSVYKSLEEIIVKENGNIFNNAAQIWNHSFYWCSMSPFGGNAPSGLIADLIFRDFGNFQNFKNKFTQMAMGFFGSGWVWLVQNNLGKLSIETTLNAGSPIRFGLNPILVCDLWEHSYYVDYRNQKLNYINNWWKIVDWNFATKNLLT